MIPRVLRKPRLQLALFVFLLAMVLFWQARAALTPFVLGLIVAYLILPLVNLVQRLMPERVRRRTIARPLAILTVYLLGLLLMLFAVAMILPPILDQVATLYRNADDLYLEAQGLGRTLIGVPIQQLNGHGKPAHHPRPAPPQHLTGAGGMTGVERLAVAAQDKDHTNLQCRVGGVTPAGGVALSPRF